MRRQSTAVALFGTLLLAVPLCAEDPKVDFNAGKDHSGIVESAKKQRKGRWAKPLTKLQDFSGKYSLLDALSRPAQSTQPVQAPATDSTSLLYPPSAVACDQMPPSSDDPGGGTPALCGKKRTASTLTSTSGLFVPITGPYEPLPRDDQDYQDAVGLKSQIDSVGAGKGAPSIKGSIPPPIRDALLNRWPNLYNKRMELITQSKPLDADDESLSRFAYRLNVWYDTIKRRKSALDSQLAQYNSGCLGRPLPDGEYQACESYRVRFNSCAANHNASLNERNRLADVWYQGKSCLETRGNSFRNRVRDWVIGIVKPWSADARAALAKACDPLISVSAAATPQTILPRKTSVLEATPKYSTSGPDSKPCPTTYKWKPLFSTLGILDSDSIRSVTFTSSGQRGTQDYRVEASDDFSTKVAGTVVTVAGGTICPVTRSYDPADDKTTCEYHCATQTMTITHGGNIPCPEMFDP